MASDRSSRTVNRNTDSLPFKKDTIVIKSEQKWYGKTHHQDTSQEKRRRDTPIFEQTTDQHA
jgi:hypothetical protein